MDKITNEQAASIIEFFEQFSEQQALWQVKKGWALEGNQLREKADRLRGLGKDDSTYLSAVDALRNYNIAKLALITTEVAEAIEEIRNGHHFAERYQSVGDPLNDGSGDYAAKPEGVLSELADVIIRVVSLVGEQDLGVELGAEIVRKLNYNATRPLKHGGKTI